MLPLRDKNPSPVTAWVVYGLMAANVLLFLFEIGLSEEQLQQLLYRYGFVPVQATQALRGEASLSGELLMPLITSMFLHGGWAHVLGNMWFLFIFGDNVEARLGHVPFLLFYLFCGLAASGAQYGLAPGSELPTIGASGAIAGVLGAYAVCWPRARVVTLVPILYFIHLIELPALLVLGFWFLVQLLQGAASLGVQFSHGGVAYGAHVGGFVVGAALIKLLPRRKPPGRQGRRGGRPWR